MKPHFRQETRRLVLAKNKRSSARPSFAGPSPFPYTPSMIGSLHTFAVFRPDGGLTVPYSFSKPVGFAAFPIQSTHGMDPFYLL